MNEGPSFVTRIVWQEGKLGTKLINSIFQLSLTLAPFIFLTCHQSCPGDTEGHSLHTSSPEPAYLLGPDLRCEVRVVIRKPIINSIFGNIYHIGVDIDKAYLVNIILEPEFYFCIL